MVGGSAVDKSGAVRGLGGRVVLTGRSWFIGSSMVMTADGGGSWFGGTMHVPLRAGSSYVTVGGSVVDKGGAVCASSPVAGFGGLVILTG